jgi:hypothetical protein
MVNMESIKYIINISGIGGGYEEACQTILQAGWEWMNKKKDAPVLEGHEYKDIFGIFTPDSPDAKELSKVITNSVDDCAGAMHHAVMGHLFWIYAHSIDEWKQEIIKRGQQYKGDKNVK